MNVLLFSSMQANAVVVNILGLLMFLFILLIVFVPEILFRLVPISERNSIHHLAEFLPIKNFYRLTPVSHFFPHSKFPSLCVDFNIAGI